MPNLLNVYKEAAVQAATPIKLVVMLYEGAVRFLQESVSAIECHDLDRKRHAIDRAVAVIQHLQSTLDLDSGRAVAGDLNRLYDYITSRVLEGSAKLDTAPLKEAIKLLSVVLAGWEELAKREQHTAVSPGQLGSKHIGGFELHA
jgi:flagellar protein FliS